MNIKVAAFTVSEKSINTSHFGYSFLSSCSLVQDDCHAVGLLCFFFLFFIDVVPMFVFATCIN